MGTDQYEVVVVRYGSATLPRNRLFLNDFLYGEAEQDQRLDYYFWVLRNDERSVLIDTGFSADVGTRRGRTVLVDPLVAIRALGVGPEAAPPIVVTHMHYDHIGNVAAFADSQVTLARAEFEFWTGPLADRPQFAHLNEAGEIRALEDAHRDGRVTLIDGETELFPGITLIPVGGHTPGQLMVLVETPDGPLLLTSDAVHLAEELELGRPFIHMDQLSASYAAYDRIAEIAAGEVGLRVVLGHDPGALETIPHAPDPLLPDHAWIVGAGEPSASDAATPA